MTCALGNQSAALVIALLANGRIASSVWANARAVDLLVSAAFFYIADFRGLKSLAGGCVAVSGSGCIARFLLIIAVLADGLVASWVVSVLRDAHHEHLVENGKGLFEPVRMEPVA